MLPQSRRHQGVFASWKAQLREAGARVTIWICFCPTHEKECFEVVADGLAHLTAFSWRLTHSICLCHKRFVLIFGDNSEGGVQFFHFCKSGLVEDVRLRLVVVGGELERSGCAV